MFQESISDLESQNPTRLRRAVEPEDGVWFFHDLSAWRNCGYRKIRPGIDPSCGRAKGQEFRPDPNLLLFSLLVLCLYTALWIMTDLSDSTYNTLARLSAYYRRGVIWSQIEIAFLLPLICLIGQLQSSLLDRKSNNSLHQSSNPTLSVRSGGKVWKLESQRWVNLPPQIR